MKKLLSIILAILTLALCIAPIAASADETTDVVPENVTAEVLRDLYNVILWRKSLRSSSTLSNFYTGKTITVGDKTYNELSERFCSYEKIEKWIREYYSGELADAIVKTYKDDETLIEKEGVLFDEAKTVEYEYICDGADDPKSDWVTLKDLTYNKDGKAAGTFAFSKADGTPVSATVRFERTDDGWRICGGTAYEYLVPGYVDENPATGESDVFAFAILGAISLAAVTVLAKKRRIRA